MKPVSIHSLLYGQMAFTKPMNLAMTDSDWHKLTKHVEMSL